MKYRVAEYRERVSDVIDLVPAEAASPISQ